MEIAFVRSWKTLAARGIVGLLFGVVALSWPTIKLTELVILFGGYALLDGVLALATGAHLRARVAHRWLHLLEGFIGVGIGLAVFLSTGITTLLLVDLIGVWAVATGVLEIAMAVRLRHELPGEVLLVVAGASSALLGVLMLLWPVTGAFIIVILLGCYALFFGTAILMLAIRLRRLTSKSEPLPGSPGTPHRAL